MRVEIIWTPLVNPNCSDSLSINNLRPWARIDDGPWRSVRARDSRTPHRLRELIEVALELDEEAHGPKERAPISRPPRWELLPEVTEFVDGLDDGGES